VLRSERDIDYEFNSVELVELDLSSTEILGPKELVPGTGEPEASTSLSLRLRPRLSILPEI